MPPSLAPIKIGEKLTNEWDGMTHDYTRKGGVVHTEIMLPPVETGMKYLISGWYGLVKPWQDPE